jgi:two-component system response regulator RegA
MKNHTSLLLVEDDQVFSERLRKALVARGCEVFVSGSCAAAMVTWRQDGPDAAVVDLRLPDGHGLSLVRELHAEHPERPVVVLTSFGSIATAMEAVRWGARDYLTKPADAEQILAALRGERLIQSNSKEVPPETPSLDRVGWEHIQRVLTDCDGNVSQAARWLGIDRRTLQRKLGKYPPIR